MHSRYSHRGNLPETVTRLPDNNCLHW